MLDDPTGYGRIVRNTDGSLKSIVEQKEADEETLRIKEVNSGGYWFDTADLLSVLDDIKANNSAKEYYLPDALYLLLQNGRKVGAFTAKSPDTVLGANDPAQLQELNDIARAKGY
jgi:bifunctional UDP-N-acetylglucosamine pyrophosphorylase/glucosamine-1-phosphate N-acetyltransferase